MSTLICGITDLVKTKTRPWRPIYQNIEVPRPKDYDIEISRPKNHSIEKQAINPQHRDSKTFFQGAKSHDIEISRLKDNDIETPRLKGHRIKFPQNSDT